MVGETSLIGYINGLHAFFLMGRSCRQPLIALTSDIKVCECVFVAYIAFFLVPNLYSLTSS